MRAITSARDDIFTRKARPWYMDDPTTDWSKHTDESGNLKYPIHRGFRFWPDDDVHAHINDSSKPIPDRAQALVNHIQQNRQGLGMHWTDDPQHAEAVAESGGWTTQKAQRPDNGGSWSQDVVLHAAPPHTDHIEKNIRTLDSNNVTPFEGDEGEVPLRKGAPVNLTGISWRDANARPWDKNKWIHHNFDNPIQTTASLS